MRIWIYRRVFRITGWVITFAAWLDTTANNASEATYYWAHSEPGESA